MSKRFNVAIVIAILICCFGCSNGKDSFSVSTKQSDDVATIETVRDRLIVSIQCPKGISNATIERKGSSWPGVIELRLHLGGLESLEVSSGRNVLDGSYSTETNELAQFKDGNESEPLTSASDYWMNCEIIDANGKVTADPSPPEGYFAIKLPKKFLSEAKSTIVVDWIDFHR